MPNIKELIESKKNGEEITKELISEKVDPWVMDQLKRNPRELVDLADSRLGWAMAEQLEDLLNGERFSKQNPDALRRIKHFAFELEEDFIAGAIDQYLHSGDIEYLHEFE